MGANTPARWQASRDPRPLAREGRWGHDTVGLEMNDWFDALARRFTDTARERGAQIASPELDPQVATRFSSSLASRPIARSVASPRSRALWLGLLPSAFARRDHSHPQRKLRTFEPSGMGSRPSLAKAVKSR